MQRWLELLNGVWVVFYLGLQLDDRADAGRGCSTPPSLALIRPGCSQGREFGTESLEFGNPLLNSTALQIDEVEHLTTGRRTFLLQ